MGILFNGIADVEGTFGLDEAYVGTLPESDAVHHIVRFVVYQFQFDVFLIATDYLACSIIVHVMCAEHRFLVVGTERVESFQFIEELRRDIFKSISASISITALVCSGSICSDTKLSNLSVNACTFSTFIDSPAA